MALEPTKRYQDIIRAQRPSNYGRRRMARPMRAAQFSPFAALVGYDGVLAEQMRETERWSDLDESHIDTINRRLEVLRQLGDEAGPVVITYFVPDDRKEGGLYSTKTCRIRKVDIPGKFLLLEDDTRVPFRWIADLTARIFESVDYL